MMARKRLLPQLLIALFLSQLAAVESYAGDKSFSTVVKNIKSNYGAKQQGFFGMMMLARFAVRVVKPAGVKNFKVALLRELDMSRGPEESEFQRFTRSAISKEWQPLVQFSSRQNQQYTYVYAQHLPKDVKLLVVTLQKREAVVVQLKFSPEKLMKFMDDPKIMGISLKDNSNNRPGPHPGQDADEDKDDPDEDEKKPPR